MAQTRAMSERTDKETGLVNKADVFECSETTKLSRKCRTLQDTPKHIRSRSLQTKACENLADPPFEKEGA